MKKIQLLIALMLTLSISFSQDRAVQDLSHQIKIGQPIPNLPLMPIVNHPSTTVDLDDYKNKVIILDFWDTFCATCIELMPHVKQVQQEVGDKAQIFTVTWQSKEVINNFFKNNRYLKEKNTQLPSIVSDTLLKKYFPHTGVPHTVFIYKGIVRAITYADYIKPKFINELIENGKLNIPVKDDFNNNRSISQLEENVKGKVLITGYQDGLEFKGGLPIEKDTISGMFRTSLINTGILDAFMRLDAIITPPTFIWIPSRIEWQVKDPTKYKYKPNSGGQNIWETEHAICYQRFSQDTLSKREMAQLVKNDLTSFLGVEVNIEKKERDAVVIRKTDRAHDGPQPLANGQMVEGADNLAFLIDLTEQYPPAFDESGLTDMITIPNFSSLEQLNKQLVGYGLEAVVVKRIIDTVVVKEK